jgi:hypothetical protein
MLPYCFRRSFVWKQRAFAIRKGYIAEDALDGAPRPMKMGISLAIPL